MFSGLKYLIPKQFDIVSSCLKATVQVDYTCDQNIKAMNICDLALKLGYRLYRGRLS